MSFLPLALSILCTRRRAYSACSRLSFGVCHADLTDLLSHPSPPFFFSVCSVCSVRSINMLTMRQTGPSFSSFFPFLSSKQKTHLLTTISSNSFTHLSLSHSHTPHTIARQTHFTQLRNHTFPPFFISFWYSSPCELALSTYTHTPSFFSSELHYNTTTSW